MKRQKKNYRITVIMPHTQLIEFFLCIGWAIYLFLAIVVCGVFFFFTSY